MSTMTDRTAAGRREERILREGYGDGAWHGPDLQAALADVTEGAAFRRPAAGRHSIAEIAIHHAFYVHGARAKLSGANPEPFVLEGEDWFTLEDGAAPSWPVVLDTVRREHAQLAALTGDIATGATKSPLSDAERFDLVLGITCHAVYHAGQIQLIKRLIEE